MKWLRRLMVLGLFAVVAALTRRWRAQHAPAPAWPERTPAEPAPAMAPAEPAPAREPAGGSAWIEPVDGSCPLTHPVKANDDSRIYHVPGGRYYDRVVPERCYRTSQEAERDGYRAAKA